jgi:hypothetical protein
VYRFCEACINAILEDSENQEYYENLLVEASAKTKRRLRAQAKAEQLSGGGQPQQQTSGSGNVPAIRKPDADFFNTRNPQEKLGFDPNQILSQADNQPKSWIAKKISSLRGLYQKWLKKANEEKDEGKIGMFKNIARVIMNVIDKLLAKLQKATDKKEVNASAAAATA